MQSILERLKSPGVLVADGAMGTQLLRRGLEMGQCPEKMNLEQPEVLTEIARMYLDAGAEIIQTNTFGGSPLKLAQYDLDRRTEEINVAAVRAVREAVGDDAWLSASCGPCGRLLKPYGDAEPSEVAEGFQRQMRALVAQGVDMVCIETMTDLTEARLAVEAARAVVGDVPVAATMTFDPTPRGFFTMMGVSVKQAVGGLSEAGADILGSNCGNGVENMVEIAAEFAEHTDLPLLIQSNAGLPELKDGRAVYSETPEFMAEQSLKLVDCGVRIIGGCCGTTPEHITALRRCLDARQGF